MKNLFFDVKKVPIESLGIKLKPKQGISHAIVTDKEILSFVSSEYQLLTNREIYDVFSTILKEKGFKFEFRGINWGNSRFRMSFIFPKEKREISKGDAVAPEIRIYNSYDRHLKFDYQAGVHRLICTNGLTALDVSNRVRALHTGSIIDHVQTSLEMTQNLLEHFDLIIEGYEDLAAYKIGNPEARVDEVIEETSYPISLRDLALERLEKEVKEGLALTDWLVYNALNYALTYDAPQLLGRKADKIDEEVLTFIVNS